MQRKSKWQQTLYQRSHLVGWLLCVLYKGSDQLSYAIQLLSDPCLPGLRSVHFLFASATIESLFVRQVVRWKQITTLLLKLAPSTGRSDKKTIILLDLLSELLRSPFQEHLSSPPSLRADGSTAWER